MKGVDFSKLQTLSGSLHKGHLHFGDRFFAQSGGMSLARSSVDMSAMAEPLAQEPLAKKARNVTGSPDKKGKKDEDDTFFNDLASMANKEVSKYTSWLTAETPRVCAVLEKVVQAVQNPEVDAEEDKIYVDEARRRLQLGYCILEMASDGTANSKTLAVQAQERARLLEAFSLLPVRNPEHLLLKSEIFAKIDELQRAAP